MHPKKSGCGGSYLQGVVVWGGIWVALLLVGLVLGITCSVWSCWSCTCRHVCCCKTKAGAQRKFCCCIKAPTHKCSFAYFCAHALVLVPLLVLMIFLFLGHAKGNAKFVDSINLVLESPAGFSDISSIAFDVGDSMIGVATQSVEEVIRVNASVTAAVR